jgi:hypothetical protein
MSIEVWADNATGALGSPGTTGQTTISVAQTTGVFPSLGAGDVFHLVIDFDTVNAEIVVVTALTGSVDLGWSMTLQAPGLVNDHNPTAQVALVITKEGLDSMVAESVVLATFTTAGDTIYGTGAGAITRLGIGTNGYVYTVVSGHPAWVAPGAPPTGSAGGDLTGTYPDPTINSIQGVVISGTPAAGDGLYATGTTTAAWSALTAAQVETIFAAAGDLLIGTGAGTGEILSYVADGDVLVGDSGLPAWASPASIIESAFSAAGDLFVGIGSGTGEIIPIGTAGNALIVGGADPSGLEWGNPSLPVDYGTISSPVTATANTAVLVETTDSLGEGTWLITVNALVSYDSAATAPVVFYLQDDTASATFNGPERVQAPYPTGSGDPVPVSFTTLAGVSAAGTIDIFVFNIDTTHDATVQYQDNETSPQSAVTGYTAVKVA